jgi:hypothetical protein
MPARTYEIHDNGGTPFLVTDTGSSIKVSKQEFDLNTDTYKAPKHAYTTDYTRIFIGGTGAEKGNSIVAERADGTFVFVGWKIQSFKLQKGDEPVSYKSPIGNNDVPYPYLVGKTHTYLMIEEKVIPNEVLNLRQDPYAQYYGFKPGADDPVKPHATRLRMKTIHKRL